MKGWGTIVHFQRSLLKYLQLSYQSLGIITTFFRVLNKGPIIAKCHLVKDRARIETCDKMRSDKVGDMQESVQRSTTKVKFKRDLKPYLIDLLRPVPR